MGIAVVVTSDGHRPDRLREALHSIGGQQPRADERCLVLGRPGSGAAGPEPAAAPDWQVVRGSWASRADRRNAGLAATKARWVIFWDAANVMPPGFLRACQDAVGRVAEDVGVVYGDLEYAESNAVRGRLWRVPDYDYWQLRSGNVVDAASAWRREAVELAGGWPVGLGGYEDFALALHVTSLGWRAQRRDGPPVVVRADDTGGWDAPEAAAEPLFHVRSLGILTLLSGRSSTYDRWVGFLREAELPRRTSLHVVDNSGDAAFTRRVRHTLGELGARFERVCLTVDPVRYGGPADEPYFVRERHLHVARLYATAVPTLREDLVLTLEDDVEPPPDAVRLLVAQLSAEAPHGVGVVAAAYDMGDEHLCAGRDDGGWGSGITWADLGDRAMDVGSVGGGCTLWGNWALHAAPVAFRWYDGLGWDGSACAGLRRRGVRVQLHGGVRCTHHVHGVVRHG